MAVQHQQQLPLVWNLIEESELNWIKPSSMLNPDNLKMFPQQSLE